jgi:hypothetical protein
MRRAFLLMIAACEGGQSPPPTDAVFGDASDACIEEAIVSGELIDWDSSTDAFLGIAGAVVTQRTDPSRTITTAPNGRVEICPHPDLPLEFIVDHPSGYLDGILSIERDAVPDPFSVRAFTSDRAATFYAEHGLIFDPNLAHLVVQSVADRQELSLNAVHDTVLAASDDDGDGVFTWGAGSTGRYVLFPNIQGTITSVAISAPPDQVFTVPVAPGDLAMAVRSFVLIGP